MQRIGLFGGSFDPVHNGHIAIAMRAFDELRLDKLIVLPAAVNPFKTSHYPSFSDNDRLLFLRTAFSGLNGISIDTRELSRGGISYAIDTVRELSLENVGAELFFIIGEDSLEGLPRWKDYGLLKKLCSFKAYPRTRESSTEIRRRLSEGEEISSFVNDDLANVIKSKWRSK